MIEVEDLCQSGFFFTWTKNLYKAKIGKDAGVLKKLDRVLVNENFLNKFNKAYAEFKPYIVSDHSPAVVIFPESAVQKRKAFKFANYIADKEDFIPTVEQEWSKQFCGFNMFKLTKKMKNLKHPLKKLNWNNGNLFENVEKLRSKLKEVQGLTDKDPYDKKIERH